MAPILAMLAKTVGPILAQSIMEKLLTSKGVDRH